MLSIHFKDSDKTYSISMDRIHQFPGSLLSTVCTTFLDEGNPTYTDIFSTPDQFLSVFKVYQSIPISFLEYDRTRMDYYGICQEDILFEHPIQLAPDEKIRDEWMKHIKDNRLPFIPFRIIFIDGVFGAQFGHFMRSRFHERHYYGSDVKTESIDMIPYLSTFSDYNEVYHISKIWYRILFGDGTPKYEPSFCPPKKDGFINYCSIDEAKEILPLPGPRFYIQSKKEDSVCFDLNLCLPDSPTQIMIEHALDEDPIDSIDKDGYRFYKIPESQSIYQTDVYHMDENGYAFLTEKGRSGVRQRIKEFYTRVVQLHHMNPEWSLREKIQKTNFEYASICKGEIISICGIWDLTRDVPILPPLVKERPTYAFSTNTVSVSDIVDENYFLDEDIFYDPIKDKEYVIRHVNDDSQISNSKLEELKALNQCGLEERLLVAIENNRLNEVKVILPLIADIDNVYSVTDECMWCLLDNPAILECLLRKISVLGIDLTAIFYSFIEWSDETFDYKDPKDVLAVFRVFEKYGVNIHKPVDFYTDSYSTLTEFGVDVDVPEDDLYSEWRCSKKYPIPGLTLRTVLIKIMMDYISELKEIDRTTRSDIYVQTFVGYKKLKWIYRELYGSNHIC